MTSYNITKRNGKIESYDIDFGINAQGEHIQATITRSTDPDPNSQQTLPALWKKHGFTPKRLRSWWTVETYATDNSGDCHGFYNPTNLYDGVRVRNDFTYMDADDEQNFDRILYEIHRRAFETFEKIRNVELVVFQTKEMTKIPKAFVKNNYKYVANVFAKIDYIYKQVTVFDETIASNNYNDIERFIELETASRTEPIVCVVRNYEEA